MMKFDKEHDLLIVPDVHGRTFWRQTVMGGDYAHVVFLGDYTDPYPHEGIDRDSSVEMFREIVAFAEEHEGKVTLLLGNHDMHYISETFDDMARGSRYSMWSRRPVSTIYKAHSHLFSLAFEADYDGKHCLLTHAGVTSEWLHSHEQLVEAPTAANINALMESEEGIAALADVGWARGGWASTGGPMWADYTEVAASEPLPGILQIFGHTQTMRREPIVRPHLACVDCHRTFMLSELVALSRRWDRPTSEPDETGLADVE